MFIGVRVYAIRAIPAIDHSVGVLAPAIMPWREAWGGLNSAAWELQPNPKC